MGKRTFVVNFKLFLLFISSIIVMYLILLERGLNPKINHLLNHNGYFWGFAVLGALVFSFIGAIISMYIFEPLIVHPIFNFINSF